VKDLLIRLNKISAHSGGFKNQV